MLTILHWTTRLPATHRSQSRFPGRPDPDVSVPTHPAPTVQPLLTGRNNFTRSRVELVSANSPTSLPSPETEIGK
jgi:hypothetical protein